MKCLADFELGPKIGHGQFSIVYKARTIADNDNVEYNNDARSGDHSSTASSGLLVAVKKINIDGIDVETQDDYIKEIRLLQNLAHENVIQYISSFTEQHALWIVLELASGGDLMGVIDRNRSMCTLLDEAVVWDYFTQLCHAVDYIHHRRIIHRDIKPANVFLTQSGKVKLGDFGLGRSIGLATVCVHSLVGTPYYMSPERVKEEPYSFKSDVWSLGCLLYELCALQSPFFGHKLNLYALANKIKNADFPPIPSDTYSSKTRTIIAMCIRADMHQRPSMRDLADMI